MRVWIDGASAAPDVRIFGMGLVERHLHAVRQQLRPMLREVRLDRGGAARDAIGAPDTLPDALPLTVVAEDGPVGARLRAYVAAAGDDPVLAVSADALVDPRLLTVLSPRAGGWLARGEGDPDAVLLRLDRSHAERIPRDATSLAAVADVLQQTGTVSLLQREDFPSFVRNLRRAVPPYLFTLRDEASRRRCERFLFGANYKGSTDVLTKYVYPPAVWVLTRALADLRVHPNLVTGLSILFAFGAVPLFATGAFLAGMILAYAMSLLDSVDGKLARLTFADSRIGNVLDHGLDIVHPPLWYAAWAWGLTGGAHPDGGLWAATLAVIAGYVLDRLVLAIYPAVFKRGLHTHAPIDALLRTFIARRNTNLLIMTAGLLAGEGVAAFYVVTGWQALTLAYHAGRTAWILLVERARPRAA